MKYVITGATSFIGSEFTKLALETGHVVYAVCREGSKSLNRLPKNYDNLFVVYCEMSDYYRLDQKIKQADIFVNFAWDGTKTPYARDLADVQEANIKYTTEAMYASKRMGCRLFVESGSQAEYGVVNDVITEETPCNPFSEYGKAKLKVYRECSKISKELDVKYLHLRIFSVFGEYDHDRTLVMNCIKKMISNEPVELSSCTQNWNFLYIRDAVKQIYKLSLYAIDSYEFKTEIFNIASKDTRILREFVESMREYTHSNSELIYGANIPENLVSLNPSILKTEQAIGFVSNYSFEEALVWITERIKKVNDTIKYTMGGGNNKCLICGCELLENESLAVFHNMPGSAQDIPSEEDLPMDKGIELKLLQCPQCGLVQFPCAPVPYYKKVIRAGGGTTTMVNLRNSQYQELLNTFDLKGKKILEVGCGKGEFLRIWEEYPVRAIGIEYDSELVKTARNEGLEVYKAYADDEFTVLPEAPYDAFVQFNFLEHQPYPNDMLKCIYNNLTEDGVGLVTVPSLEYILKYDGYYELIKDHIAYYSEETLKFLFQKNGFEIVDCHTVNRDTHSIMVKKRKKVDVSAWKENYDSLKTELHEYVDSFINEGKKVAVWGASHQGFTLIPSLGLSDKIAYIIDSAPFKQGKFAPASHVPIVDRKHFFDEPVDSILIVAPGYTEEIANIIKTELSAKIDIRTLRTNHLEKL